MEESVSKSKKESIKNLADKGCDAKKNDEQAPIVSKEKKA